MVEDRLLEPRPAEIRRGKSVVGRRQVDGDGPIEQAVEAGVMRLEATAEVVAEPRREAAGGDESNGSGSGCC